MSTTFQNSVIVKRREKMNLSQEALARLLDVSVKTVSNWEIGKSSPTAEYLPVLADTLETKVSSFYKQEKSNANG